MLPTISDTNTAALKQLFKVYFDNFIGSFQAPSHAKLLHTTQAILQTIHCILPTNDTRNPGQTNSPINFRTSCTHQRVGASGTAVYANLRSSADASEPHHDGRYGRGCTAPVFPI